MSSDLLQYLPFYIYLALNVAVSFLRSRRSGISPYLYVASLLILFYVYCFRWVLPWELAMLAHIAACAFAIMKGRNWILLPFTLYNLVLMMPFAHYGPLELAWFMDEEMHPSVDNALGDASSMVMFFIIFILVPIILVKTAVYLYKRHKKSRV